MGALIKYAIAAIAGLGVFGFGSKFITEHMSYDKPAMEAAAVYFKMEEAAWKKYPQDPVLVALGKYSHEQAAKEMDGEKDEAARRKMAATIFLGFYLDNGRARGEFCAKYGVDVAAFVRAFEERHAELHAKALAVLADEGTPEESIYDENSRAMHEHVSYEMLYLDSSTLGLKDACAKLVEKPYAYLPRMNFSEIEPGISNTLLSTPKEQPAAAVVAAVAPQPVPSRVERATASLVPRNSVVVAAIAAPSAPALPLRHALID
jgi:hypothetical protein